MYDINNTNKKTSDKTNLHNLHMNSRELLVFGEMGNLYINMECINEMFNIPNYKNRENSYEIIPIYYSNKISLIKKKNFGYKWWWYKRDVIYWSSKGIRKL